MKSNSSRKGPNAGKNRQPTRTHGRKRSKLHKGGKGTQSGNQAQRSTKSTVTRKNARLLRIPKWIWTAIGLAGGPSVFLGLYLTSIPSISVSQDQAQNVWDFPFVVSDLSNWFGMYAVTSKCIAKTVTMSTGATLINVSAVIDLPNQYIDASSPASFPCALKRAIDAGNPIAGEFNFKIFYKSRFVTLWRRSPVVATFSVIRTENGYRWTPGKIDR